MADRPILFSGSMVRALLAGRKTQTRRVLRPQPEWPMQISVIDHPVAIFRNPAGSHRQDVRIPYAAGDRLWVKEHWRTQTAFDDMSPVQIGSMFTEEHGEPWCPVFFEADKCCDATSIEQWQESALGRFRQSMHMPRWASRITLLVSDVRVERLQECSVRDSIAEGIEGNEFEGWREYGKGPKPCDFVVDPRRSYATLWDSINGEGAWDTNPWVVAVTFEIHSGNIDAMPEGGAA